MLKIFHAVKSDAAENGFWIGNRSVVWSLIVFIIIIIMLKVMTHLLTASCRAFESFIDGLFDAAIITIIVVGGVVVVVVTITVVCICRGACSISYI